MAATREQKEYDAARDAFFQSKRLHHLRLWNPEFLKEPGSGGAQLLAMLDVRGPLSLTLSPEGQESIRRRVSQRRFFNRF